MREPSIREIGALVQSIAADQPKGNQAFQAPAWDAGLSEAPRLMPNLPLFPEEGPQNTVFLV